MKILGIGNALVDVLVKLENDDLLRDLELPKGSMNLIDFERRNAFLKKIHKENVRYTTGGSVGNTCLALANLGASVSFVGKIGNDDYGQFFVDEYTRAGVETQLLTGDNSSGTAICLITPDGERTFGTYLGVAAELKDSDLQTKHFEPYTHLYAEGYLVQNHDLIEGSLAMAKSLNLTTALDLSSYNIVDAEREFLSQLIDSYVDILFANEEEAKALTGKNPEEAVREIGENVQIAVVKVGGEGSWIMKDGEVVHVPVNKILPMDTTAAGDYYAAGFFYGLSQGFDMKKCGEIASLLANAVIQVIGTKLPEETWKQIRSEIK